MFRYGVMISRKEVKDQEITFGPINCTIIGIKVFKVLFLPIKLLVWFFFIRQVISPWISNGAPLMRLPVSM